MVWITSSAFRGLLPATNTPLIFSKLSNTPSSSTRKEREYVAEDARRDVIRDATLAQTDQTVFPVCDTDGFDKNNEYYNEMNHRALENGTLFKADTIEELAKLIKVPPEVMVATINEYNAMVDSKKDPLAVPRLC